MAADEREPASAPVKTPAETGTAPRNARQNDYLAQLAGRLAAEDFAKSDQELPHILRLLAAEQVELCRTRNAVHLERAALLIEQHLATVGLHVT